MRLQAALYAALLAGSAIAQDAEEPLVETPSSPAERPTFTVSLH